MAKTKKKTEKKSSKEVKKVPTKWAREEGIDEMLFLYWKSKLMTRKEYEKIKNKVYRRRD